MKQGGTLSGINIFVKSMAKILKLLDHCHRHTYFFKIVVKNN